MATFVLVHGAYHGAWCWERLRRRLELAGHRVFADDLPGHGEDFDPARASLSAYADATAALVSGIGGSAGADGIYLVGHSMAGAVIAEAAERVPDLIARLVFLTAYLPQDGQSVADLARLDEQVSIEAERTEIGGVKCLALSEATLRRHFYQDASDDQFRWVAERVRAQAIKPFVTPAALTDANFGRVPRAYIHCEKDQAIGLFLQRRMERATPCAPVLRLAAGHSPFVTDVDALAAALHEIAV